MIKAHWVTAVVLLAGVLAGCSDAGDSGDVEKAKQASAAAPKDVSQLPANMDPRARASAEAAILQNKAMTEQMNAQAEAMKRAREGTH